MLNTYAIINMYTYNRKNCFSLLKNRVRFLDGKPHTRKRCNNFHTFYKICARFEQKVVAIR